MKKLFKSFIGKCRCLRWGIIHGKSVYIGKGTKLLGKKKIIIGNGVQIRPFCDIYAGDFLRIGSGSDIGTRCRIAGNVVIEENVLLGPNVFVCRYDHDYKDIEKPIIKLKEYEPNRNGHSELLIGEGSWIGTNVVISGDVHVGKHCVIGANAVVIRDIPDYSVAVGSPAKVVKTYNFKTNEWISV